jgi:hypothetical protein
MAFRRISAIIAGMLRFLVTGLLLPAAAVQAQLPPEIEARLPPAYYRAYIVAVCAAAEEITDDCMNEGRRNAAHALSEMYLRAFQGKLVWNSLRLRFPYGWAEKSQTRFLQEVERAGIALAGERIAREAGSSDALKNWQDRALIEAASGVNWSHDWGRASSHDFAPGHVMRQLAAAELRR